MPLITVKLNWCKKCMQLKNHTKEIYEYPIKKIVWTCQKCGYKSEELEIK